MKLVLNVKESGALNIELKNGAKIVDRELLTIAPGFDSILIGSIDKLLSRNRIERLSLKKVEIAGEIDEKSVSGMIIRTVAQALRE